MNTHNSVIDNASAETTIPDRILRTALTPWRQGNFVEVADQFSDVTHDYSARPGIRLPRIAIVGTGFVGSTTAYALLLSGMAAEVILIGRDPRRAEGHVHDLRDAEVFSHRTRVFAGEFDDCYSADVTILTVGVSQSGAKSRLDGLRATAAILRGLVRDVSRHDPRGVLADRFESSRCHDVRRLEVVRTSREPDYWFGHIAGHCPFPQTPRREVWRSFRQCPCPHHWRTRRQPISGVIVGTHSRDAYQGVLSTTRIAV